MNKKLIGLVHQTIHRRICHGVSSVSYKQFVQLSYLTKSCVITCHILVVANREKHGPSTEYMFFFKLFSHQLTKYAFTSLSGSSIK